MDSGIQPDCTCLKPLPHSKTDCEDFNIFLLPKMLTTQQLPIIICSYCCYFLEQQSKRGDNNGTILQICPPFTWHMFHMINSIILIYKYYLRYTVIMLESQLKSMGRGVFQFKSFWDTVHVQMMYPLPNPRISHTDARLFMNMVQIRLKSQDFSWI